jgi:aminoglycoside phosphotransferase (APT) family kinase protein
MNTVLTFLTKHWQRFSLEEFGAPPRLASVIMTPRFRASSHVIFFVLAAGRAEPILVVKVPRLPGDNSRLDREAANLRLVQTAWAEGFASIPRVIAYEDYGGHRLLIETALRGQAMSPAVVRRHPKACVETVLTWLMDLHHATAAGSMHAKDWHTHLVERPLERFERVFPLRAEEKCLLEHTRELISPLHAATVPLVFEHGDLSSPNLLLHGQDSLGVVDWELAEPQGLPAVDLFFFLTYITFAQRRCRTQRHYRAAFHNAFFGPTAWARPYIVRYAERMQLPPEVLKPLFVLCWSRYVANIVVRLNDLHGAEGGLEHNTATWLRTNRYYALWRHTVDHVAALNF